MIENPAVGQVVRVAPGTMWSGQAMRDEDYVIVKVADYRAEGIDDEFAVVVVVQDKAWIDYCTPPRNSGHTVNPEHGAYLGREQLTAVETAPVFVNVAAHVEV